MMDLLFFKSENKADFIPAPQMHEIAQLLPLFILNDTGKTYVNGIKKGKKMVYKNHLYLSLQENYLEYCTQYEFERAIRVEIINHHYAQAYAELYLQLKEKGLI